MHEMSLINDLMKKIERVAREQGAKRVSRVEVTLGALSHISADHFREHFVEAAHGTLAQDADLRIEEKTDLSDPHAQEILLTKIDVEVSA